MRLKEITSQVFGGLITVNTMHEQAIDYSLTNASKAQAENIHG